MLPVNEIFETLQGEATFTGTPAVFLRLQGCPVGCPWCDTKHTWGLDPADEIGVAGLLSKPPAASPSFARMTVPDIGAALDRHDARHVVITGGEPCVHDLSRLTAALCASGRTVQLETSGTHPVRVVPETWVTVSPKVDMPGGLPVLQGAVRRADELKWPVGKMDDVEALHRFLEKFAYTGPVWLQPLSRSAKATALCVQQATVNGWRVSVQVHALIGVR